MRKEVKHAQRAHELLLADVVLVPPVEVLERRLEQQPVLGDLTADVLEHAVYVVRLVLRQHVGLAQPWRAIVRHLAGHLRRGPDELLPVTHAAAAVELSAERLGLQEGQAAEAADARLRELHGRQLADLALVEGGEVVGHADARSLSEPE